MVTRMINWLKAILKHMLLVHRFPSSKIYFGAVVDKRSTLGAHTVLFPNTVLQNSELDSYSYVQQNSVLSSVRLGKFCSIASNVHIGLANHPTHMVSTSPVFYDNTQPLPFFFNIIDSFNVVMPKTVIASDVWIGQGVMIKSGVQVGVGAVIGAGAVVTKNIEPYSIVAGVPAKHIKWRFDESIRVQLIRSQWWELGEDRLNEISHYFSKPKRMLEEIAKG